MVAIDWSLQGGGAARDRETQVVRSVPAQLSPLRFVLVSIYQTLAWTVATGFLCALVISWGEDLWLAGAGAGDGNGAGAGGSTSTGAATGGAGSHGVIDGFGSPTHAAAAAHAVATAAADAARAAVQRHALPAATTAAAAASGMAATQQESAGRAPSAATAAAAVAVSSLSGAAVHAAAAPAAVSAATAKEDDGERVEEKEEEELRAAHAMAVRVADEAAELLAALASSHEVAERRRVGLPTATGVIEHGPAIVLAVLLYSVVAWLQAPRRYVLTPTSLRIEWRLAALLPTLGCEEIPFRMIHDVYQLKATSRATKKALVSDLAFLRCRTCLFLALRTDTKRAWGGARRGGAGPRGRGREVGQDAADQGGEGDQSGRNATTGAGARLHTEGGARELVLATDSGAFAHDLVACVHDESFDVNDGDGGGADGSGALWSFGLGAEADTGPAEGSALRQRRGVLEASTPQIHTHIFS